MTRDNRLIISALLGFAAIFVAFLNKWSELEKEYDFSHSYNVPGVNDLELDCFGDAILFASGWGVLIYILSFILLTFFNAYFADNTTFIKSLLVTKDELLNVDTLIDLGLALLCLILAYVISAVIIVLFLLFQAARSVKR